MNKNIMLAIVLSFVSFSVYAEKGGDPEFSTITACDQQTKEQVWEARCLKIVESCIKSSRECDLAKDCVKTAKKAVKTHFWEK